MTLLLDRDPPALSDASEPAEITIELTPTQAARMAEGRPITPCDALTEAVSYRGPVRKYLTIDAVLRHLLTELVRGAD